MALIAAVCWAVEPKGLITFNDDGAWSWFEDERAIVHQGKLWVGSVASGWKDPLRRGDIEVVVYDLKSRKANRFELHDQLANNAQQAYDDHNSPALLALADGRVLAAYSAHGTENRMYFRISEDGRWGAEQAFVPSDSSRVTYSNLFQLAAENGRIYQFFRGLHNSFKPSYAWSDDGAATWQAGGIVIQVPSEFRHRPYVKYASNGKDEVHLLYTEGHPRNYDNSVYHVVYRSGVLHASDGTPIAKLTEGLSRPEAGTRVFAGGPQDVAWVSDLALDRDGRPYAVYSVQKDSAGLEPGKGGEDHRYRYARWTGSAWVENEIAYAGSKLYPREDDYTGNITLDPDRPEVVYISTNVDPATGKPLVSAADGKRHWEIYRGVSRDSGRTFAWSAVTRDSEMDNIRPIVPKRAGGKTALLWLRGTYTTYTNYRLAVVGLVNP